MCILSVCLLQILVTFVVHKNDVVESVFGKKFLPEIMVIMRNVSCQLALVKYLTSCVFAFEILG